MTCSVISIFSGASEVLDLFRVALCLHMKEYLFTLFSTINFQSLSQYVFFQSCILFKDWTWLFFISMHIYLLLFPSKIYPKKIVDRGENSPLTALSSTGEVVKRPASLLCVVPLQLMTQRLSIFSAYQTFKAVSCTCDLTLKRSATWRAERLFLYLELHQETILFQVIGCS